MCCSRRCCCCCLFSVLSFNHFCSPLFRYILLREYFYSELIRGEQHKMLGLFAIYKRRTKQMATMECLIAHRNEISNTRSIASTWSRTEFARHTLKRLMNAVVNRREHNRMNERPSHIACIMNRNLIGTTNISHSVDLFGFCCFFLPYHWGNEPLNVEVRDSFFSLNRISNVMFMYTPFVVFHFKRFTNKNFHQWSLLLVSFNEWSARPIFLRLNHILLFKMLCARVDDESQTSHFCWRVIKWQVLHCKAVLRFLFSFSAIFFLSKIAVILFMVCNAL